MVKKQYPKLKIFCDGGARGNPGPAGAGVLIYDDKEILVKRISKYLGKATNNQAEYQAVILALQKAKELEVLEIDFYLDSELLVNQLNMKYKIKNLELGSLFVKTWNLRQNFKKTRFFYIPRQENRGADFLVNQAIDKGLKD